MEVFELNVYRKRSGIALQTKLRAQSDNGLILSICSRQEDGTSGLPRHSFNFVCADLDFSGPRIVAATHVGQVFIIDIKKNWFWQVCFLGHCCSAIKFVPCVQNNILVGRCDGSLFCCSSASQGQEHQLARVHKTSIFSLSVKGEARQFVVSCSVDLAAIWDIHTGDLMNCLETWSAKVDLVMGFYSSAANQIVTAFQDGNVCIWNSEDHTCLIQFKIEMHNGDRNIRSASVSRDGELLAAAGRGNQVVVVSTKTGTVQRILNVSEQVSRVRHLSFWDKIDYVLVILSQEGKIHLYNVETEEYIATVKCVDTFLSFCLSQISFCLAATNAAGELKLFDLQDLLKSTDAPLVKVSSSDFDAKTLPGQPQPPMWTSIKPRTPSRLKKMQVKKVNTKALKFVLQNFGEFPEKYRFAIWRHLLHLPENNKAFSALAVRGVFKTHDNIHLLYPIQNKTVQKAFTRMLSALCHWCPMLGDVDYLPLLVFPFVKLLHSNMLLCFEVLLSILCTWCQNWFLYFPFPPYNILGATENILAHYDPQLLQYFVQQGITSQIYAWPLLCTAFSEVVAADTWISLWDHIFSSHPSFLLYLVVAFNMASREVLLNCRKLSDIQGYFHHLGTVDTQKMITQAYELQDKIPKTLNPDDQVGTFAPLPQGTYPFFDNKFTPQELEFWNGKQDHPPTAVDSHNSCFHCGLDGIVGQKSQDTGEQSVPFIYNIRSPMRRDLKAIKEAFDIRRKIAMDNRHHTV